MRYLRRLVWWLGLTGPDLEKASRRWSACKPGGYLRTHSRSGGGWLIIGYCAEWPNKKAEEFRADTLAEAVAMLDSRCDELPLPREFKWTW